MPLKAWEKTKNKMDYSFIKHFCKDYKKIINKSQDNKSKGLALFRKNNRLKNVKNVQKIV